MSSLLQKTNKIIYFVKQLYARSTFHDDLLRVYYCPLYFHIYVASKDD